MNTWSKYLYRLRLATAFGGLLFGSVGFVRADEAEVEQLEENLKIAETTKIYGKGSLGTSFTVNNYSSKPYFSPVFVIADRADNPNSKVLFSLEARLGLKKETLINEKKVKFDFELSIDKEKNVGLKKGYAEFSNILLGYTMSSFADPDVIPNVIGGLPGSTAMSSAIQLRWKDNINADYTYTLGIEEAPKFDLHTGKKDEDKKKAHEKPNNDIPAIAGNVRYKLFEDKGHIQLGAVGRLLQYYHTKTKTTDSLPGFGVNLGTKVNIVPKKTIFKTNAMYGKGLGGYIMDLSVFVFDQENNAAYIDAKSNKLKTLDVWGVYADIEYHLTPEVRFALTGGLLSTIANENNSKKDAYKTGVLGALKACYHPTEQFHIGLGYLLGSRSNENKKQAAASRIQFESVFKF